MSAASLDTATSAPTTAHGAGDSNDVPISPVTRSTSFPHRTISAAPVKPFIDTATPAINDRPVELDASDSAVPAPRKRAGTGGSTRGQDGDGEEEEEGGQDGGRRRVWSPDVGDEVHEELIEGRRKSRGREKRAALLEERREDPAVLVDIPQIPAAEELAAAAAAGEKGGDVEQTPVVEQAASA